MRSQARIPKTKTAGNINRLFVLRTMFILMGIVIVGRLFYIQVLHAQHYKDLARGEQFRQLEIQPERGTIYMQSGTGEPVVLTVNESRYTIVADPVYVTDAASAASELSKLLSIDSKDIEEKLRRPVRYVVLAKRVSRQVKQSIEEAKIKGVAWQEDRVRTYPQGDFAAHLLGFVNDEGVGQYGVEGALDNELKGQAGSIRAITDREGVPLVQNKDNIVSEPVDGADVVLSTDQTIQQIAQDELKLGVERSGAKSGSVVIMEAATGRVKAMANYPSYSPADYATITDQNIFKNQAVSDPFEPGSIMKTLLVGAALDSGVISAESTYFDSGVQTIDGVSIRNLTPLASGQRSIFDILQYSLNTGAIELLKDFGGGDISADARSKYYGYLTDRYHFGEAPAIELEEATTGYIPDPLEGDGLRVQYANMAFGQGMTMTPQQIASALSAAVNGGTYYEPTVVYARQTASGLEVQPPAVRGTAVISKTASDSLVGLMKRYEESKSPSATRPGFVLGGKTGTAQVPGANGSYREDVYNATFAGFLGRETPKYVIIVRLNEGKAADNFSGFEDARPVYLGIVNSMMDNVAFSE